LTTKLFKDGI